MNYPKPEKKCIGKNGCNKIKPLTEFYLYNNRYKITCKSCLSSYQNNINKRRPHTNYNRNYYYIRMAKPTEKEFARLRQVNLRLLKVKNEKGFNDDIGCSVRLFRKWIKYNQELDKIKDDYLSLDHFYSLSSYKCKTLEDIRPNFWCNIRPINMVDNLRKHTKIPNDNEIKEHRRRIRDFLENVMKY